MRCSIPEGESGNCKVERFAVSDADAAFSCIRAFSFIGGGRSVPAGEYTRLLVDGGIMMSDTPDELRDHIGPVRSAIGTCLVSGLGLGCVVKGMLEKKKEDGSYAVDKVVVLEINEHVIKLVEPHLRKIYGDRLDVRNVDALKYKPPMGERYDYAWHDIWPTICEDNLKTMSTLHRKYGRRCDRQGSWQRDRLLRMRRESKRQSVYWR